LMIVNIYHLSEACGTVVIKLKIWQRKLIANAREYTEQYIGSN
jgi:hypothetical protein